MTMRACMLGFVLLCTSAVSFTQFDQVTKGLASSFSPALADRVCCQSDFSRILFLNGQEVETT